MVKALFAMLFTFVLICRASAQQFDFYESAAQNPAMPSQVLRSKACSPDKPIPYEHDGADAASVIDWITAQPWSDGRVGMYEGSYNGFTQWATAKYMPKGLKAIMTGAPAERINVPVLSKKRLWREHGRKQLESLRLAPGQAGEERIYWSF